MRKYDDVEHLNKDEVEGILNGTCHIFEKIDGANISLYYHPEKGVVICSRNNEIWCEKNPTGGFRGVEVYVKNNPAIIRMVTDNPQYVFYGEWLVRHTVQYPADVENRIYFFDIYDEITGKYLHWLVIEDLFKKYSVEFVPLYTVLENPTEEQLKQFLNINLFKANKQEGIVIKNYEFVNKFGRTQWTKIVNKEFKEANKEVFSQKSSCCDYSFHEIEGKNICDKCGKETTIVKKYTTCLEEELTEKYITLARVDKIKNKIVDQVGTSDYKVSERDTGKIIEMVYYDFIQEELWDVLKKYHNPTIDFMKLRKLAQTKSKEIFFVLLRK